MAVMESPAGPRPNLWSARAAASVPEIALPLAVMKILRQWCCIADDPEWLSMWQKLRCGVAKTL
jgi:hypothetical protein